MKFNLKKIKPPGFLKKISANRHARYVIYAVSFTILIAVSVYAYSILSRQYEQKTEFPPVQGTDQVLRRESEPQTVGETKETEKTSSDTEHVGSDSDNRTEKEESPESAGGIHSEDPKLAESSKQPENTKKPDDTKKTDQTKTTQGTDKQGQTNKTETTVPTETEPPETESLNKHNAPNFTVLDKDGNRIGLSDKFGKPIVINFWATWCPPCKQELPDFDKLYREYGNKVTFMMVNLTDGKRDTVDGTKNFVSKNGYTFPVYFDTAYEGFNAYNVSSIPQTTFIDKNGNIYTTRIGAMNEATLRSYINAMLGG